jgi:hypothetical protein
LAIILVIQESTRKNIRSVSHERTGRPLGSERFVKQLEKTVDRIRLNQNPRRKKRGKEK